jgi:hypothetical protein
MIFRIELSGNSQFRVEKEMAYNSNSAVWMACIVLLESLSGTHFQFLFGCINHRIGLFFSLDNKRVCTYINSRISNIKIYRNYFHT